jgi:protein-tyrosine phosphatase
LQFFIKNKVKVYIHCKHGHGRAPTLVAAYFIAQGMSVAEALKFVKSRRPSIHPNRVQVEALKQFLNRLSKSSF